MKKVLFSVAILAAFASCQKTEVDMPQTKEIGFSALNNRTTKVGATEAETAQNYKVYTTETASGATAANANWAINDVVTGTSSTANNAPYYWPTDGATMSFYAYAPYGSAQITDNQASSTASVATNPIAYTVGTTAQEDFTVATPVLDQDGTDTQVDFTFAHMLSKVSVEVVLAGDNGVDATGTAVAPTANSFASNYKLEVPGTATITTVINKCGVDIMATAPASTEVPDQTATTYAYSGYSSYNIAPQTSTGCKVQINGIKIKNKNTGSYLYDGDLEAITIAADDITGNKFVAGTHYVLTITVDGTATPDQGDKPVQITFSATTATWNDATGGLTQI